MKKNLLMNSVAFLMCLFLFAGVSAQSNKQKQIVVTSPTNWVVPTTLEDGITPMIVDSVTFEAIGGGGAGGYMTQGLTRRGAGGGGGGAYAKATVYSPTGMYTITPGTGGTNILNANPVDGSASTVTKGATEVLVAAGGSSAVFKPSNRDLQEGAEGGKATACYPQAGAHSGGNGGDPYGLLLGWLFSYSGGGGGAANSLGDGYNALYSNEVYGGNPGSGDMPAGRGGNGRTSQSSRGVSGETFGGGGSGATAWFISGGHNGGAGAPGVVVITVYYTSSSEDLPTCGKPIIADGQVYQTVLIGSACWMAENLRAEAPEATYYDNDNDNAQFGKLYNWNDAVGVNNTPMTALSGGTYIQGACPNGWAIPTTAQFNTMLAAAGDVSAIKSDDESTWLPGEAGTNASGFGAMGAGYYESNQYQRLLGYTYYWTSELTSSSSYTAKTVELRCGCGEFTSVEKSKENKLSVRCVRAN
jgi:uncharacterized protein (TIGR02145 family)